MTKEECIDYVKFLGGIETKDGWNVPKAVNLINKNLTEIPIKFNIIQGNFWCRHNQLTSLKNCPNIVYGSFFDCSYNRLTSLKYCPKEVIENFFCDNNRLTSLKYCPKTISGHFWCRNNKLISFKYFPKEVKLNFDCDKGTFEGKDYYKFLLEEKVITKEEYLLRIL